MRQGGTENIQIGWVDALCQQILPSRYVPRHNTEIKKQVKKLDSERVHPLLSGILRNDDIFLKGVEKHNVLVSLWNANTSHIKGCCL